MSRIAIIGMSCLFPGAANLGQYWDNICAGVDAISDVPEARWDARYYDPNSSAVDQFYCRRGGFVDDLADFDPLPFGIMPKLAEAAEPDQLLTLRVGYQALRDAGYDTRAFDRARTGVIIGRGNYVTPGVLRLEQHVRLVPQVLQTLQDLFPEMTEAALADVKQRLQGELTPYGPDVASSLIPNFTASRLANRLDLGGAAYTVDAACASSLLALEQASRLLSSGDAEMMLVGGVHLSHDPTFWATFCQLGALSRRGVIAPLSADADGILAGEGVGMVVLKRLEDATRDGDRIYAVIDAVGSASDGRSSSLVAPSVSGQLLALERAWAGLPIAKSAIGLVEAHGTGTPTGDGVELETLAQFFGPVNDAPRAIIGSVKSMIGHAMPASGMASLIKTAMAIHHGVLPPTLHCQQAHPLMAKTRFRTLAAVQPWTVAAQERIAAVNAFGFGGINAHVVMSGVAAAEKLPALAEPKPVPTLASALLLQADTPEELLLALDAVIAGETPPSISLMPVPASSINGSSPANEALCRLVVLAPDNKRLLAARKIVAAGKSWSGRQQIWFSAQGLLSQGGKFAFVFPGVDSVFKPQADDLATYFKRPLPAHCESLDPAQDLPRVVRGLMGFNRFMHDVLGELGIAPHAYAGHSIGEWSAMLASGMMDQALSDRTNATLDVAAQQFPDVRFLAAACDVATLQNAMAGLDKIALSHDNCPHQVIACGREAVVAQVAERLREAGIFHQVLPIVSGFHSPLFIDHLPWYREFFNAAALQEPTMPVWSATLVDKFPVLEQAKRDTAIAHLLEPVRFRELTERLYDDGVRVFVQVGTGSLPGFISDTLAGRPHLALHSNHDARSGLVQLQQVCAALWVEGAHFDMRLLIATAEANALPPAKMLAAMSGQTRRLALGVPLIRLRPATVKTPYLPPQQRTESVSFDGAMGGLVADALGDIDCVRQDIVSFWQQHQKLPHAVSTQAAEHTQTSALAKAQQAKAIHHVQQRYLCLEQSIACVRDHELYPQRQGWPIVADRHPVVPMTMEVLLLRDALREQLAQQHPGWHVVEVFDIKAFNWLVVSTPLNVELRLNSISDSCVRGEIVGYFSATLRIAAHWPSADKAPLPALIQACDTRVAANDLYQQQWMFHGPAYQGVTRFKGIGSNGIDGELRVPSGQGALLDNMGQLAGYWVMEQPENCLAMPIGVGSIRFYGPDPVPGESLQAQVRINHLDDLSCNSSHQLRTADDRLIISIDDWQTRRYQMDKAFWEASRLLSEYKVSREIAPNVVLFDDRYDTAILRDYLSRRYLTATERTVYDALSPRRKRSWLNGRVAAKDATRVFLQSRGISGVYPQEIIIENDALGAPHIHANVTNRLPDGLSLSIAHKGSLAVAIVSDEPVGIDLESIKERSQEFVQAAFGSDEQRLLNAVDEPEELVFTRGWVAKEVAAKQSGHGLAGAPKNWPVSAYQGGALRINNCWVYSIVLEGHVMGWSLPSALAEPLLMALADNQSEML
ncbi:beta-ketoacyl synthase N-terminal-like domain-containing protein [Paraperlucidibaca sp.]|uniref:beta-ketoacyl synthase N-terminal-like domain-containing protein n=1 Tax=Paraperlucidibaca sp. TaxID=2708021 RepID=UPI0030F46739